MQVEQFVRFFGNAVKYTLAKWEAVCMNGLQSTIGVYGFRELFRVLWNLQGRSQDLFRGTHNFPNAPASFASGRYDL